MAGSRTGLPDVLDTFLGERGLRTLGDIRRAGGLLRRTDLPLPISHAAVVALEAHADLSRVSDDVAVNARLIESGYTSVTAIADAPRSVFLSATGAAIGDLEAARLHVTACAQCAFLDNLLAGAAAAQANGFPEATAAEGGKLFTDSCACEDCESAVSPAIYLGDLLDYSTRSILSGSALIDLAFLDSTLHQPFGDLKVSCEAVTQPVHRVRIGIEVLRGYLGARPLADASAESDLESVEASYLTSAYTALLTRIGTSYEELRLARTATAEQRRALADRLGIDLTVPRPAGPGDELDRLLLDLSVGVGTPGAIAALRALERDIEGLFGLADTSRDPLSDGAKFGDDGDDFISRWQFRGGEWGRNTDRDGRVYLMLEKPSPVEASVMKVYKDAQRQQLVAASLGAGQLLPRNGSGLSGSFGSGSGAGGVNGCSISVVPDLLSWRLEHLRTVWSADDHPTDAYDEAAVPLLALIDPDVVGPDDFRVPFEKLNASIPDQPFDLWLARRGAIDQVLANLRRDRESSPDGLTAILKQVFGDPLPDLDGLLHALTQGDKAEVAQAVDAIENLQLTVDSFSRLMALRAKDAEAAGGPGEPVAEDEWTEVYSILAQVRKVRMFAAWRSEEKQLRAPLILGMRDFWLSLREPVVGAWPVAAAPGAPLIDPDLVSLKDLPESVAGGPAIQLWNDRKARLQRTIPQELMDARSSKGYDGMVYQALGTPPGTPLPPQDDLDGLSARLASSNPAEVAAAQDAITHDLCLTLDGFARLIAIRTKDRQSDPVKKPTSAEYAEVYALLTQGRKLKTEYPQWVGEESAAFAQEARAAGEPAGSIAYWRARKSALPRWRASPEARQAWRDALQAGSARPIVDPDLVDGFDLRDPVPGNAAYDLWQARSADVATRMTAITTPPPAGSGALDQLLGDPDYLGPGFNGIALDQLDQDRNAGQSIQGRLDQLELGYAAFDAVLRVSRMVGAGQDILPSEWTDVASILVQSYKRKQFAAWRLEERPAVCLGPDLFQVRPPPADPYALDATPPPALPAWRTTPDARRTWDDTLQGRIDQQVATVSAMREAVDAAETTALASLRDGLIQATDAPGARSELVAKAEWLTQKLLLDLQAGSCQTTTRIEQAVESTQTLLYATRTGLGGEQLPPLTLAVSATDFDEKWKWLGSYATWRSAMLVFLYPENLLAPTLRPQPWQTPGFRALVAALSGAGNASPQGACRAVAQYSSYFRDVCGLIVEATCQATLPILQRDDCNAYSFGDLTHYAFFMFARSRYTNKCYWSVYDLEEGAQAGGTDFAQSAWQELDHPALGNVVRLVGAVPYKGICLFAHTRSADAEELVAFQLNLYTQELALVAESLKPSGAGTFAAAVLQDPGLHRLEIFGGSSPPTLAVQTPDGSLYVGHLNNDANAWALQHPKLVGTYDYPILALAEHGILGNKIVVVPATPASGLGTSAPDWEVSFLPGVVENGVTGGPYHGMLWLADGQTPGFSDGSALTFFIIGDFGVNPSVFTLYEGQNITVNGIVGQIDAIVPSGGAAWLAGTSAPSYQFVYLRRPDGAFRRCSFGFIDDEFIRNLLYVATDDPLAPSVQDALTSIPHDLSAEALQLRRQAIEQAFLDNADAPESLRTYLEEAFYFVPMLVGLTLEQSGEYEGALAWFRTVYDYTAPRPEDRRIYYGLVLDGQRGPDDYRWSTSWLSDTLNPHAIARTRRNAYTKYTLFSIIRCLLGFADSEFSRDTGESVARARILYEKALELLGTDVLTQSLPDCTTIFGDPPGGKSTASLFASVRARIARTLTEIADPARRRTAVAQTSELLGQAELPGPGWEAALELASDAAFGSKKAIPLEARLREAAGQRRQGHASLLALPACEQLAAHVASAAGLRLASDAGRGRKPASLPERYVPSTLGLWGCIPPHPLLRTLRLHADVNLRKIRTCRNIAGMKRALDPYAAPVDSTSTLPSIGHGGQLNATGTVAILPTLYRYRVLIERVKQLAQLSGQVEASLLAALTQLDIESYNLLKAQQDFRLAQAGVQLQRTRIKQASDGVVLAQDQQGRAQIQFQGYSDMLNNREVQQDEQNALDLMGTAAGRLDSAASMAVVGGIFNTVMSIVGGAAQGAALAGPAGAVIGGVFAGAGAGIGVGVSFQQIMAQRDTIQASINSTMASIEQRREELSLQQALASQDIEIGGQQIQIANDNVAIADQELTIAGIQSDNASDGIHFLATKFTGVDLYDWMSGVLQGVYRFFLQQATAMAKTAENQLAFERQEVPTAFIQADYWAVSAGGAALPPGGQPTDRKGLTGSARLLEDVYRLDQYAFDTLKRKLQLSKTLSLASLAPAEFQRFREDGSLVFATPSELFDRDFPGHYLRLIKRVRTSVIALIPPIQGIRATLASGGVSRVVIGGDMFQAISIRRDPDYVAFCSPVNTTGQFELEQQTDMLFPFEGSGVDMTWEFALPKASNFFDFGSIADVLITIEYTALNSFDYRQQVIRTQPATFSADAPFSFRNQFPDPWYDLLNPDQSGTPMTVRFTTSRQDFPPNIDDLRIQQVLLYFSRADGSTFELAVVRAAIHRTGQPRHGRRRRHHDRRDDQHAPGQRRQLATHDRKERDRQLGAGARGQPAGARVLRGRLDSGCPLRDHILRQPIRVGRLNARRAGQPTLRELACPEGLEPPTCCLEGNCSIRLSYGQ